MTTPDPQASGSKLPAVREALRSPLQLATVRDVCEHVDSQSGCKKLIGAEGLPSASRGEEEEEHKPIYYHSIWNIIYYLCSISVLHGKFIGDYRPHVEVYINGVCVRFLIDTGASVSVISRDIFDRIKDSACLLYTSPSPRDLSTFRMPSSA